LANAIKAEELAYTVNDSDFMLDLQVLGICSVNREEWLVTDLASNLIDVTSVPLYETLGDDMLEIILVQTEITTLFGSDVCLKNILKLVSGKKINLKQVVTFDKNISD
jgi:long-chain acyl-CoA synthetase